MIDPRTIIELGPNSFLNPSYGEEKGRPADLVRKGTVKLRLYRESYDPDRFSMFALDELAALDRLGQIVVSGVKPSEARAGWLIHEYGRNRGDVGGKRKLSLGPFVGSQSFKNARFDLKFKDHETALDFAHMLVTGQPRISTAPQAPLIALELQPASV